MSLNNDLLFSGTEDSNPDNDNHLQQPNSLLSEELVTQQQQQDEENENMIDYETVDSILSSPAPPPAATTTTTTTPRNSSGSGRGGLTKEQFIEILARDEDESDDIHANDYNFILSALVITTEPTLAKLACQAIDKVHIYSSSSSSSFVIPDLPINYL